MKRSSFLRDCLLGIAASLVPRLLQPVMPEVVEGTCLFNEKMLNDRIAELRKYPHTVDECYLESSSSYIISTSIHNGVGHISHTSNPHTT